MEITKISKKMSYMLRHSTDPLYIDLNGGWADVDVIIKALKEKYPQVNRALLDEIVAGDEKGRYSYNADGTKIRANQGHSIPGVIIEMEQPQPPEYLYHGTASRFLDSIMQNGLIPMSRQYVHISPDYDTAVNVGKRHGKPVVLVIDAGRFVADGNTLYLSANGIWQAKHVPPEYFTVKYIN